MQVPPGRTPHVTVRSLIKEASSLRLVLLAGESGLGRQITVSRVQKPGLALAGYVRQIHPERVQVLGATEISYLASLPDAEARHGIEALMALEPACFMVTKGLDVPAEILARANEKGIPVMRTPLMSSAAIELLQNFLEVHLAASCSLHAVLVDVLGVGILLLGKSSVGKSEAALELIMRGHRLVADDLVEIRRTGQDVLVGWPSDLIKHHMEIRGLGIINIEDLFGVAAVRDEKKIELVIELVNWNDIADYDRLGLDNVTYPILDVQIPFLRLPVSPGRNVSALIEVAARNRLLQVQGHHSAREFQARLERALEAAGSHRFGDDVE